MNKIKDIKINLYKINDLLTKGDRVNIATNVIFVFIFSITIPLITYIYKIVIDNLSVGIGINLYTIILLVCTYIFLQLFLEIFETIKMHFDKKTQFSITNSLLKSISLKMFTIRLEELEKAQTHDCIERVIKNLANRAIEYINLIINILSPIIISITYALILISIRWYFIILIFLASIPYSLVIWKKLKADYQNEVMLTKENRKLEYLTRVMSSREYAKEVRLFRASSFLNDKIENIRQYVALVEIKLSMKYARYEVFVNILKNLALGICLFVTGYDILHNDGEIGNIVLIISAVQSITGNISRIMNDVSSINQNSLYFGDWYTFNNLPNIRQTPQKKLNDLNIVLQDVCFRYPNSDRDTLKNISLKIQQNQKVAIIGGNGSGKSSLINIILGNYMATQGRVEIGGMPLDCVIDEYRKITVSVFQDFIKYQLSARDNLETGNSEGKINIDNFKMLDFIEFIASLPKGLETQLGQLHINGIELSGGQWQKLAIFRALLRKDAKILVMDEPTANLDPINESLIYENFINFSNEKTLILITHRLSAAKLCDNILVMDNGEIIEEGNHLQLMKLKGKYHEMFTLQQNLYKKSP